MRLPHLLTSLLSIPRQLDRLTMLAQSLAMRVQTLTGEVRNAAGESRRLSADAHRLMRQQAERIDLLWHENCKLRGVEVD
jgi:hypothetical protein